MADDAVDVHAIADLVQAIVERWSGEKELSHHSMILPSGVCGWSCRNLASVLASALKGRNFQHFELSSDGVCCGSNSAGMGDLVAYFQIVIELLCPE